MLFHRPRLLILQNRLVNAAGIGTALFSLVLIFVDQHFLGQKFFKQKFFGPKYFLDQPSFGTQIVFTFLTPNIFWAEKFSFPKKFLDHSIFSKSF